MKVLEILNNLFAGNDKICVCEMFFYCINCKWSLKVKRFVKSSWYTMGRVWNIIKRTFLACMITPLVTMSWKINQNSAFSKAILEARVHLPPSNSPMKSGVASCYMCCSTRRRLNRTNKNSSVSSGLHRGCQSHTKLIPLFRKVRAHSDAISFHGSGERPKPICPSLVSCVLLHVAVN
jgi:hypothetical protein